MQSVSKRRSRVKRNRPEHKGPWFRVYYDDLHDVTLQTLPGELFRAWVNLACLASNTGGVLPDHRQIAFQLRQPPHEIEWAIGNLISAGLIEQTIDAGQPPSLRMVGWDNRQYVSDAPSTERVRRFRARRKSSETFHETECNVSGTSETYSLLISSSEYPNSIPSQREDSEVTSNACARKARGEGN